MVFDVGSRVSRVDGPAAPDISRKLVVQYAERSWILSAAIMVLSEFHVSAPVGVSVR
jgi:hypothetical protein